MLSDREGDDPFQVRSERLYLRARAVRRRPPAPGNARRDYRFYARCGSCTACSMTPFLGRRAFASPSASRAETLSSPSARKATTGCQRKPISPASPPRSTTCSASNGRAVQGDFPAMTSRAELPENVFIVVLRGLDPHIHVFLSTAPRSGCPRIVVRGLKAHGTRPAKTKLERRFRSLRH